MNSFILIDTDILIDSARNRPDAKNKLLQLSESHTLSISAVTKMEMLIGCQNKRELSVISTFLENFRLFEIKPSISSRATRLIETYILSHGLLIADSLIAATAIDKEIPLISKNQKDFRFIDGLDLKPYP